ncbi:hypothetical protein KQX54_017730 [Cotesia glomerata]|uniref:Uncharacterized protein n=1 Tax=Cotesia glomerata TaxID=32391 RepID=A0AAV7HYH1_COTGL|nr:hypothetical protein KQX54_017730 [Cotesia glomerata]
MQDDSCKSCNRRGSVILLGVVAVSFAAPGYDHHKHVVIHVPYKVHTVHHHHVKKVPYPVHHVEKVHVPVHHVEKVHVPVPYPVVKKEYVPVIEKVHVPVHIPEHHEHHEHHIPEHHEESKWSFDDDKKGWWD